MVSDIENQLKITEGVKEVVDLKVWSTNRDKHYGAVKVRLSKGCEKWRVSQVLVSRGLKSFVEV